MRVGLNIDPSRLTATLAAFPGIASCRVFGPAGKGIPTWTSPTVAALTAAGVTPWISFKDWAHDTTALAAVTTWLDTIPATLSTAILTYHHEPEGDMIPADYRARWVKLAGRVRAHPNASKIKLVPIHTLYPARHKVYDRFNPDWTTWTGVWQQWAPTDSTGRYVGDWMGWDCYQEITATGYEDPAAFLRIPIGAAYQSGVPLAVPELGAVKVPTDTTGTGRATWIAACLATLRASGTTAVNWWQSTGTNGLDYRLTDQPSAAAWRTGVAAI
jgi:hypothetical protein